MVKCECGKIWHYGEDCTEWHIIDDKPKVITMNGGTPYFENMELVIYQCPCGKINGIVAWKQETKDDPVDWGVFTHPDWDDEDLDAYIEHKGG